MSSSYIRDSDSESSNFYETQNNITIALALGGKRLTKIIYPSSEVAFDSAYHYKFFNRNVHCLGDILELVKVLLARPQCCVIRGVCKDDTLSRQRRLLYDDRDKGDSATIIEQPQNWFALDVDGYGNSSGDLKQDAKSVLLALNLDGIEAIAVPSAGYLRKPGIRIRLFLWNSVRVNCNSLKKHFEQYKHVVDLALFRPIQPIYIARPIFNSCVDPCKVTIAWVSGSQHTEIREVSTSGRRKEDLYTKKQAERFLKNIMIKGFDIREGERHGWLFGVSIALGKWIYQELLDEEDVVDCFNLCTRSWGGNYKKDLQTILDGIKRGKQAMEDQV